MSSKPLIDPSVFEAIQAKINEETTFRDELRDIIDLLNKQTRASLATLSRVHSTKPKAISQLLSEAENDIKAQVESIHKLSIKASTQPYYKWNSLWSRSVQDVCYTILLTEWLKPTKDDEPNKLLSLDEAGEAMNVPVNVTSEDKFHLTVEEYLLALVSLVDELARLARNAVTVGDYQRPLQISNFIKNVHQGFQLLNLKNDILRKRSDGIKYRVKEVEDVVYDLSLRGLLSR
jgi:predicted translin family RNA/ssDNA-binding protein